MSDPQISLVIPVSKRADDLPRLVASVRGEIEKAKKSCEVVLVVDGELPERLETCRKIAADDPKVRVLRFARRFGEGAALQAGLAATHAPVLVTHPAYVQVDHSVVPALIEAVDKGADLAFASRAPSRESLFNRLQRWCFNALVRRMLGLRFRDVACGVRALRRETLEEISSHGAFHRFITVAAAMSGYETVEVDAPLHPEGVRSRLYSPLTYMHRLLDIVNVAFVTKFLHKPLRFFGAIGAVLFVPGFLVCLFMTIQRLFFEVPLGDRPLFLFGVILTVLGFQVLAIGLLGEIISFSMAARKKPYAIREVVRKAAPPQTAERERTSAGT